MYLGFALFFGVITYFIVAITPFVPKLRRFGMRELEHTFVSNIYEIFDEGVDSYQTSMLLAVGYLMYLLVSAMVIGVLSLLWPVFLIVLLIATIIFKTNKNN
jgi:hypothetical protein